jgi:hypothetical protein
VPKLVTYVFSLSADLPTDIVVVETKLAVFV